MKKIIYILLFAAATLISSTSFSSEQTPVEEKVVDPIGGLALDPK